MTVKNVCPLGTSIWKEPGDLAYRGRAWRRSDKQTCQWTVNELRSAFLPRDDGGVGERLTGYGGAGFSLQPWHQGVDVLYAHGNRDCTCGISLEGKENAMRWQIRTITVSGHQDSPLGFA